LQRPAPSRTPDAAAPPLPHPYPHPHPYPEPKASVLCRGLSRLLWNAFGQFGWLASLLCVLAAKANVSGQEREWKVERDLLSEIVRIANAQGSAKNIPLTSVIWGLY